MKIARICWMSLVAAPALMLACSNDPAPVKASSPSALVPAHAAPSPSALSLAPGKLDPSRSPQAVPDAPPLVVGDVAPDVTFDLPDSNRVPLRSLAGKRVLVYFYPKDDTPGCRIEAQGIRDRYADFQKAGVEVYGVSLQDAASHMEFSEKEKLPFPLVVDTTGAVAKAFHVPVQGEFARRQSFLIGKDGKLQKIWLSVEPKTHADEVLAAVKEG